jgi:radical SAM superfamily enzyme YgiQ (UPF0313 family)
MRRPIHNILLVYPEVPQNTYWSYKHTMPFLNKKSAMPPLGLITVASHLPGHLSLRLVDMNVAPLRDEDLLWADAVFVSAMIIQKDSFARVVSRATAMGALVVAGGPYPSGSHEEIHGVDHFILGEAEEIIGPFMQDLLAGNARFLYKSEGKPSLETTRVPRFDLLNFNAYASMSVQYSRGCPFHCEFCDIWKVYGNKPRLKSVPDILKELDALYALGWNGAVFIVDDNFIGNKARVKKELLPALISWQKAHKYPFRFYTEASINMAEDDALLALMRDAAFNEVFIGIETPSAECLSETGKIQNLKTDMAAAVAKIKSYGFEVMAGFILGFDSDTEDIADRQIAFIQKTGIPRAMVGLLTALPGTDLYNRLKREGRILRASSGNNTDCGAANFVTRMDPEKLREGYCRVLGAIYDEDLKSYFSRCNTVLDQTAGLPYASRDIRWHEVKILFRSLARQPFTPYGWQYLKFVARNLVRHTGSIAEVIKFTVIGHHMHYVTRQTLRAARLEAAEA